MLGVRSPNSCTWYVVHYTPWRAHTYIHAVRILVYVGVLSKEKYICRCYMLGAIEIEVSARLASYSVLRLDQKAYNSSLVSCFSILNLTNYE